MKKIFTLIMLTTLSTCSIAQLMVSKRFGKNASNSKIGYGIFAYYDIPLGEEGNRSIRVELIDAAYFPSKSDYITNVYGYISVKAGYKYGFGESKTGFYVEPQVGWCKVLSDNNMLSKGEANGIALALETGYSLEVGEKGNAFHFGLKLENDMAGTDFIATSLGFRVSYSFRFF
jgi:hypothetical protein